MDFRWIVTSCFYGYGGPINAFLSWNAWLPLGRLTYSAYLLHLIVVIKVKFQVPIFFQVIQFLGLHYQGKIYVNFFQAVWTFIIPIIVLTYVISIAWSAVFELETILTGRLLGGISHRAERRQPISSSVGPKNTNKL
ncbi:Oac-55 [Aphelenchoides besseyi]|nr:Oac-55 [Aphelenchoides besseyi]